MFFTPLPLSSKFSPDFGKFLQIEITETKRKLYAPSQCQGDIRYSKQYNVYNHREWCKKLQIQTMIMLRSSCGIFSRETCLIATKSPFSKSKPLYTRPYAPFPISSPSIYTKLTKPQTRHSKPMKHKPFANSTNINLKKGTNFI